MAGMRGTPNIRSGARIQIRTLPVHMHKIGLCVVAYAASLQRQSGIANLGRRCSGNANVDGFGFHVLTVQCNAMAMLTEIVIAPRGTIPADNVNFAVWTAECSQQVFEVQSDRVQKQMLK